ncbi:MAG: protein translocase subunit SecF [Bacteroidota bacterium]|nr:protein translocase subunit SecF [Bacteroidota bacterium]MDP4237416.1 protein translocase subunit SecF [Bacteroidota bacterium]
MHFFRKTNIDFIGKRRTWYFVSIAITVAGIVWALFKGVEFGIDFAGGTEVQLKFEKVVKIDDIRSALDAGGFRGAEVKYYGSDESGVLIRVREGGAGAGAGAETTKKVQDAIAKGVTSNSAQLMQNTHIGAKIGKELQQKALFAVFFTCIVILIYLAFRFKFVYGMGAVIAIVHDVLVAFAFAVIFNGIAPWLNLEMNSTLLAAFLTIVGFSVNDTVIIYDRIREDQKKYKGQDLKTIMNRAINETLPRTIITSGTVFLTLVVLFIWGGEVLRGFAFTMLVGVITGTYSSIFVASAISYDWLHRDKKKTISVAGKAKTKEVVTAV